jgi:hypothetical protein
MTIPRAFAVVTFWGDPADGLPARRRARAIDAQHH